MRGVRRRLIIGAVALGIALIAIGTWWFAGRGDLRERLRRNATAPANTRIRVEVLNASPRRGMARLATMHLRDRGFDVVAVGNASEPRDSTLIIDHAGEPEWAALISEALGGGTIESRPDSSRYVDVTVLLGRAWRPPAEPFYP